MSASSMAAMLLPGLPAMLRAAGAAALVPAFTGMPGLARAGLVLAAAAIAWPLGAGMALPEGSVWSWAPAELAAGGVIGATAAAAAGALRLAGRLIGEQMGMGLGAHATPDALPEESNAAEAALGWCSAICFVSVGGVEGVVLAAARSRAATDGWALGADGIAASLDAASGVALRVSLPVLALTLAGTAVGGVLARAAPGVMTLASGFGYRVASGLGMLCATAVALWAAQATLVREMLARLPGGGL
jgi:flagellar biosynthesis protein FliR